MFLLCSLSTTEMSISIVSQYKKIEAKQLCFISSLQDSLASELRVL